MPANLENSAVATGLEKVSFHSSSKERQCQRMFKLPHNCTVSHASKIMLKILQARLQQYVNRKLPDIQAVFRKARGTRDQIANIHWVIEKARESRKICASLTTWKPLTVWITTNCGKFFKSWEYQTTIPEKSVCRSRSNTRTRRGTTDWFQVGKGVHQGCILSPCLFNLYAEYIMWNAGLDEAQAGMKTAGRNINNLRYADDTIFMAESEEELKSLLMKVKEKSEKAGLELSLQKTKTMGSNPIPSWQIDGETMETVRDFIFLGLQNHCRWWL